MGFGIESAFLNNFANRFSENLVDSLASRMSQRPILRIGGTSGDHFLFDPNQNETKICFKGKCGSSGGYYQLGPSFFEGYARFKNARMTIQAPLEKPVNLTNSLAFVRQAWNKRAGGSKVETIALGNEVELIYKQDVYGYVHAALQIANAIVANLSLTGKNAKLFEAGNSASGTTNSYRVQVLALLNENETWLTCFDLKR